MAPHNAKWEMATGVYGEPLVGEALNLGILPYV